MIYLQKHFINIGKIVRLHGVHGALLLRLYPGEGEDIMNEVEWCFMDQRQKPVPYKVLKTSILNREELILELEGINRIEEAKNFLNSEVSIERMEDLKGTNLGGMKFLKGFGINNRGINIGTILDIEYTGSQYLFVIENGNLLPAHPDLIEKIDEDKHMIYMKLPDGLI